MEFLSVEAEDDCRLLQLSDEDEESEKTADEFDDFLDDCPIEEEFVSYYRGTNPLDIRDYPRFHGQTRNPIDAVFSANENYFGNDEQPELFAPENIESVHFNRFEWFERAAPIFRNTLVNFTNTENYLFISVIYWLMFYKSDKQLAGTILDQKDPQKVLGDDLYLGLPEIEPDTFLYKTLFGFFEWCYIINKVATKYGYFLKDATYIDFL